MKCLAACHSGCRHALCTSDREPCPGFPMLTDPKHRSDRFCLGTLPCLRTLPVPTANANRRGARSAGRGSLLRPQPSGHSASSSAGFPDGRGPLVSPRATDGCIARLIREPVRATPTSPPRYCFRRASDCCFARGNQRPDRTHSGRALPRSLPPQRRRRAGYAYATGSITAPR